MIGGIRQCYSELRYDKPQSVVTGLFVKKGAPKSLYLPGSSTDVLLFQRGRMRFDEDLIRNMTHPATTNRFSSAFEQSLVETDVKVRSAIGKKIDVEKVRS